MKKILLPAYCLIAALIIAGCSNNDSPSTLSNSTFDESRGYGKDDGFNRDNFTDYGENPFLKTEEKPLSTFAIDADGGSYTIMRRFINSGQNPPSAAVRVEEFINYFTYDYPEAGAENVSINTEITDCPWNGDHHLIRIGLKGKSLSEDFMMKSNYVFLIDVSGSMSSPDKLELLKTGFTTLADNLGDNDRIAIVTYAGQAGVLLESTPCSDRAKIKNAISLLGAGGSTAGAQGIITAYDIARQNFISGGNNRVILGTDGDFNVGTSSTDELIKMIEEKRSSGVYLTVLGVGLGNLNDGMMEQLADKGNGSYEYIDNINQIKKVFINEKNKFITAAKDCKIQLAFDKNAVESYRLIGYENRKMEDKDFTNDSADAGEIGAGQTITALYEVSLKNNRPGPDFGVVQLRYKIPGQNTSRLLSQKISGEPVKFASASENTRFAAAVAGWGMLLKDSKYKGTLTKQMIYQWASGAMSFDPNFYRSEFVSLVR